MTYKWKLVVLLFCCAALNYGDRAATASVFPLFRSDLGMTDIGMAAVGSLFLWSYALGSPFAGWLADRVSRSGVIVASLAAWSLVTLATGFATTVNQLLATRVLLGLAECLYLPASIALIADHHTGSTRASAIGIHTAGLSVGLVAGGWASGYLGAEFGWQVAFRVLGGCGVALACASHFWLRDATPPRKRDSLQWPEIAALLKTRTYLIVLAEAMVVAVANNAFMNWLALYFKETYGMGLASAGFSGTFLLQFPAVLGAALGGMASDRAARRERRGRMLLQTCCYLAAAPLLLAFAGRLALAPLSAAIFAYGLLRATGSANEHPLLCDLLPANVRSKAVGLMNATNCLAGGIGIFAAGYWKSRFGLGAAFSACSALLLLAAMILMIGYRFVARRELDPDRSAVPPALQAACRSDHAPI